MLIVGGGPVGMMMAALLASYGIQCTVLEEDAGYCSGSRAICISRRSQEIYGWIGADSDLVEKGLSWAGGRSYFRDREVLHFQMPHEPTQRFAPMVNIQQYYAEEYSHKAGQRQAVAPDVRWGNRVKAVAETSTGVHVQVECEGKSQEIVTDWLIACDGGRSTVREQLGLQLEGAQYDGRYVIVDIRQKSHRPTERLAWFDPPSNPGSTILMHRQPDDVWRIDYQIRDDEDPEEAVKPENVLPRVQSHLDMIGEDQPWEPLWISIYNAKCLTLPSYRRGRVFFAGDAGHLVPIFGVRGLNSGLDDAANLAWKLALVQSGVAQDALLDSYSVERVHATRENIVFGAKSTEFMAPPNFGFKLMRDAALRLSTVDPLVTSLLNPRQSTPIEYVHSPLNLFGDEIAFDKGPKAGLPAPECLLESTAGPLHLTSCFGKSFVVLYFSDTAQLPQQFSNLSVDSCLLPSSVRVICISSTGAASRDVFVDSFAQAGDRYRATNGTAYLIRPDGYVLGRWKSAQAQDLQNALRGIIVEKRTSEPSKNQTTEVA